MCIRDRPNACGLYDMSGNVWEWVNDWYDSRYYNTMTSIDPLGPSIAPERVNRGGSWNYEGASLRVSNRAAFDPSSLSLILGFRLARSDVSPSP